MGYFNQLRLILWKNYIIRRRHWISSLFEALLPILLFLVVSYERSQISGVARQKVVDPTYNDLQDYRDIMRSFDISTTKLVYSPSNNFTDTLIRRVQLKLNFYHENIMPFGNEETLLKYFSDHHQNEFIIAAIFKNDKTHLSYRLGTPENGDFFYNMDLYAPTYIFEPGASSKSYIQSKFLPMQLAIDTSYIEMMSGKDFPVSLYFQEVPYPPHMDDSGLVEVLMPYLGLLTVISFIFLCPALLTRIVEEKSSGTKELLKMVGLKQWMLWLGWFMHSLIANIVSIILIVIFMKVPMWGADYPAIVYCDFSVFFVFLLLYVTACITFCFFISTFFTKTIFVMSFGVFSWLLTYIIPAAIITDTKSTSKLYKLLFAALPNCAMNLGYRVITDFEVRVQPLNWTNLFESGSGGVDDVSLGNILVMFFVSSIFYALLAAYISNVFPGPYGIPKSFHLGCLDRLFSTSRSYKINVDTTDESPINPNGTGISIKHLQKRFGNTVAVDNLNLDILKNQITVLLGHNGAGKTTTMFMLTGMIQSGEGKILVYGKDIQKETDEVRKLMGLCPQHNLLFNDLTVREHLELIGRLKGSSGKQLDDEIDRLLNILKLNNKGGDMANTLSGGMKRKLCLAMALIGQSQVLILDEPTAGMDPESQREVWDLLLEMRGNKTILISTHYMDEADALADSIAIMANGKNLRSGTPMELKKQYETGYHLLLTLNKGDNKESVITDAVRSTIPLAKCKEFHEESAMFVLPIEDKSKYPKLLEYLEQMKDELNIKNISLNITTLEDVFLKSKEEVDVRELKSIKSIDSNDSNNSVDHQPCASKNKNFLSALLLKRLYFLRHKWHMYSITALIALVVMVLTMALCQQSSNKSNISSFGLTLSHYGASNVYYSRGSSDVTTLSKFYAEAAAGQKGDVREVESVSGAIINKGIENIEFYKRHIIVSAEFNDTDEGIVVNAMFGSFARHGIAISANLIMNTILKTYAGPQYSISTLNTPLVADTTSKTPMEKDEGEVGTLWAILFPLGLLFLLGSNILFPFIELSTGFSRLQMMCGFSPILYWITNFLFDFGLFFILSIVICFFAWIVAAGSEWTEFEIFPIVCMMTAYGFGAIPFSYLFARFKTAAGGFALLLILGLLLGVNLVVVVVVMKYSGDDYYVRLSKILEELFLVVMPQFGITITSVKYALNVVQKYNWDLMPQDKRSYYCRFHPNPCCQAAESKECEIQRSFFLNKEYGIERDLLYMLLPMIFYLLLNILIDYQIKEKLEEKFYGIFRRGKDDLETGRGGDCLEPEKSHICTKNLQKYYRMRKVVEDVSFEVKRGHCFGLLGVNGAGKTTTFKMLTKEILKSKGYSKIIADEDSARLIPDDSNIEYLKKIGYTPQINSLNFDLTAYEILRTFALLRGYKMKESDVIARKFVDYFDLGQYADKPCGTYSGGNKRKLCLALGLIGYPPNVFLDEPTNGVDPGSRRGFWEIIKEMQYRKNLTFLLTSHSMQECEALCNELGIMKDGQIMAKGPLYELKDKYKNGYTVKIKLNLAKETTLSEVNQDVDEIDSPHAYQRVSMLQENAPNTDANSNRSLKKQESVHENNPSVKEIKYRISKKYSAHLKDEHWGLLHYQIRNDRNDVRMSQLFKDLELMKDDLNGVIEDYVITESSLEDVFLSVAKGEEPQP